MNEFKFQFINFLLLALLVGGMYWAFGTINNGVTYSKEDLVQDENINDTESQAEIVPVFETPESVDEISFEVTDDAPVSGENTELMSKLQGLIDDNINMKNGSRGTRVGTVQKFLNIYFKTSKTVDNEYGPGTMADVKKFQSAEGLGPDGLAGPNTYKKMIDVLKK